MFYLVTLLGMAALVALDQLTKIAAVAALSDGPIVLIPHVFQLYLSYNTGAAFSLGEGKRIGLLVITTAALMALAYALFSRRISHSPWVTTGCVLALSGGIGNWIDRLFRHRVTDFLYFDLINFPIFNVADICVVSGAIVLLVYFLLLYREPAKQDGTEEVPAAEGAPGNAGTTDDLTAHTEYAVELPADEGLAGTPGEEALSQEHGETNADDSPGQNGRED